MCSMNLNHDSHFDLPPAPARQSNDVLDLAIGGGIVDSRASSAIWSNPFSTP
jgi:hypothetical protein